VFDRMQYMIGPPERVGRYSNKYAIKDFDGNLIGNIISNKYKSYGLMPLMEWRFFDDHESCQGILRQRKPGFMVLESPPLDVLSPLEETRGRIEYHGDYRNKTNHTVHYGNHTLFDALNRQIASSTPYAVKSESLLNSNESYEYLQRSGLDFKAPDGRTIATIRGLGSTSGCQIDLFPPVADAFLVLSFAIHVLLY
jgi:hypothetical protein